MACGRSLWTCIRLQNVVLLGEVVCLQYIIVHFMTDGRTNKWTYCTLTNNFQRCWNSVKMYCKTWNFFRVHFIFANFADGINSWNLIPEIFFHHFKFNLMYLRPWFSAKTRNLKTAKFPYPKPQNFDAANILCFTVYYNNLRIRFVWWKMQLTFCFGLSRAQATPASQNFSAVTSSGRHAITITYTWTELSDGPASQATYP